jgi:outer membrane protein
VISVQVSFRKILLGSLIAAMFSMPAAAAELKIGVVDVAKLFEESPQAKVVQENLKAEFGPRLQQLIAQEQALKTGNEKDLRDRARELERKKAELQDDSNAKRQEEMNKLQRLLFGEVRDYAKAQNFDIVIAEGVIYATPTVDITAAVLASLQARAPKPAAGAAPAPAKPPAKP